MSEQPTESASEQSTTQRTLSGQAATERAEELLGKWEQQARMLVAVVRQQLGTAIAGTQTADVQSSRQERASAAQPGEETSAPSTEATHPAPRPAPERAEAILDAWGQRIGRSASLTGQRLRKAAARAREEAEDILAEAQHIRKSDGGTSNPA